MVSLKEDIEEYLVNQYKRIDLPNVPVANPTKEDLWKYYMSDEHAYFIMQSVAKDDNLPSMPQLLADVIDMQLLDNLRILVYGCGEDLVPLALRINMKFTDITIADVPHKYMGFLRFISDKYGLDFKLIPIVPQNEYPLEKEYDFIICNNTIGMEWDPEATLRHLTGHLANFGWIYLGDPNPFKGDTCVKIAENIGLTPKYKDDSGFKAFQKIQSK